MIQDLLSSTFKTLQDAEAGGAFEQAMRLKYHYDFFSSNIDGNTQHDRDEELVYDLPDEFDDWQEWEHIVVTTLAAIARHTVKHFQNAELALAQSKEWHRRGFPKISSRLSKESEIDREQWIGLFDLAGKNGKASLRELFSLLQKVNRQDKKPSLNAPSQLCRDQHWLMRNWIIFDLTPGAMPGLCVFDNESIAMIWAMNRGENISAMSGPHFSRAKTNLGLSNPAKRTWGLVEKRTMDGENELIAVRH